MRLALFDLDNTLLPLDSDAEWGRFLVRERLVDPDGFTRRNEEFLQQYRNGTLDIQAYLEFQLAPLASRPPAELDAMHRRFMQSVIEPALLEPAFALVARHRDAGDLCAVVTATNEFVTGPIVRALGIEHLVATTIEYVDGRFTGRARGIPAYREGKIVRTGQWLAGLGLDWTGFADSFFYSDSHNDLPLMSKVSRPVATNPDQILERHALEHGWPVIRLFE
ncbi:MAG: HAD family hydrolase [Burkholderiaceae bacterium]